MFLDGTHLGFNFEVLVSHCGSDSDFVYFSSRIFISRDPAVQALQFLETLDTKVNTHVTITVNLQRNKLI